MTLAISGLARRLCMVLAVALALLPSFAALAQQAAPPATTLPDPLTPAAIEALVSRMTDNDVRALLLEELGNRVEPATTGETAPKPALSTLSTPVQRITEGLRERVLASPQNSGEAIAAVQRYGASLGPGGAIHLLLVLVVAVIAGIAIDVLLGRWVGRRQAARNGHDPENIPTFPRSILYLGRRLLKDAVGALLALIAGAVIIALMLPERETRVAMSIAVWLFFFPRMAGIVLQFFLSPKRPELRLVEVDDRTAGILLRSLVGVLFIVGLIQTVQAVMHEVGASGSARNIGFWVNLLIFIWLAILVIRCRDGLRQIVRGNQDLQTPEDKWIVAAYPAFALIAIAFTWIAGLLSDILGNSEVTQGGRHFLSLGILLVAPMCDTLIRATVRIVVPPMKGSGAAAEQAFEAAWRSYIRIARVIVFGTIIVVLAKLWGMSVVSLAEAGVGEHLGEKVVVSTLILLAGFILIEVVSLWFNRQLSNMQAETGMDANMDNEDRGPVASGGSSRAATILPPLSWTLQAAIIAMTLVTALGQLGVNVTALLAGAGVVGIAIGFGAQKMVADLISGVFYLLDDAFRINEYIAAGSIEGTVEKIGFQSMHLRKSDGAIHVVPYSNAGMISNFSRDWGTAKVVFTVPFDTDIERVRKIFKKIGEDLSNNPEFKDAILQPFKFKGVSQVNDVGIVVRGKFMFKPEFAKQFLIQREIYRRVQKDFAQAGIQFARREVHVSVDPSGEALSNVEIASISAANIPEPAKA